MYDRKISVPTAQENIMLPVKKKSKGKLITIISVSCIAVIGVITAAVMLLSQPDMQTQTDEQISLGEKYLSEENYDEAIIAFKKAIDIQPNNPELYIKLADAYTAKGDTDNAVKALEDGYEKTGDESIKKKLDELQVKIKYEKFVKEGQTALSNKNYDEAVKSFESAIELKPNEAEPYLSASDGYIGKEDIDNAVKTLEKGYEATKSEEIKAKLDELNNTDDTEERYAAYLKAAEELMDKCGEGKMKNTAGSDEMLYGLAIVKLPDFDGDGKEELYCVYPEDNELFANKQAIYSYDGDKAVVVYNDNICNYGTGVEPYIRYIESDGKVYLETRNKLTPEYTAAEWKELKNGSLQTKFTYESECNSDMTDIKYKVNEISVSKEEYETAVDEFENNGEITCIFMTESTQSYTKPCNEILSDTKKVLEKLGYKSTVVDTNTTGDYKTDFINALLNNEDEWAVTENVFGGARYYFEDLDLDGKPEFLVNIVQGSGLFTSGSVYCLDDNGKISNAGTFSGNEKIYYNQEENKYKLISYDYNKDGVYAYTKSNIELTYENQKISSEIFSKLIYTNYNGEDKTVYSDGGENKISENEYNKINEERIKNYIEVNINTEAINYNDWKDYSDSEKKAALGKSYDSFTYEI